MLPSDFTVTIPTRAECLSILEEPRLKRVIGKAAGTDKTLVEYLDNCSPVYHIIKGKGYSMLFTLEHTASGIYDYHVACPKDSIIASRVLIMLSLCWIFNDSKIDVDVVTTECTPGKIANTARKAGAIEVANFDNKVWFLILARQFRRLL